jgi:hypothetical protein
MSKSDKKLSKTVSELKINLDACETIEHPIFKESLTKLQTEMLKTEMTKRAEKIGK